MSHDTKLDLCRLAPTLAASRRDGRDWAAAETRAAETRAAETRAAETRAAETRAAERAALVRGRILEWHAAAAMALLLVWPSPVLWCPPAWVVWLMTPRA